MLIVFILAKPAPFTGPISALGEREGDCVRLFCVCFDPQFLGKDVGISVGLRFAELSELTVIVNPCHARPPYGRTYPLGPGIMWVYPTNQKDFMNFYYCFNNVLHKLK